MQLREFCSQEASPGRWNRWRRQSICSVLLCAASLSARAQQVATPSLTVEEAVAQAIAHNASLDKARLETRRAQADLAANRTKRYASSSISALGAQLITTPQITFAAGSLGTYPGTGPIPGTNTTITIPRDFTGLMSASATQPLTTQIKLHFQLKSLDLGVARTKQDEREQKLQVIDGTRRAYYTVVQAQAKVDSANASLPLYKESVRLAKEKSQQETILQSDFLKSQAQLLQAENATSEATDDLFTAQEKLNDFMGRDIHSPLRASDVAEVGDFAESEHSLESRALQNRPDIKKAQLNVGAASYDLRAKKAEYIPEISGSVSYYTTFNFGNTLPSNIGLAGLSLSWEPWDWGRKRHEIDVKKTAEQQAEVAVAQTTRSALMEVSNARRQLQSARRNLALTNANQEVSREKLHEVQEQFKREEKLPKDLFQAQSDLADADSQRAQSLAKFWQAFAELKKSIGEE